MTTGAEIRIRGMVQGIGYRYFCYTHATTLGLVGWVKNEPGGSVVAVVEGDRSSIEALIKELKVGPSHAAVSAVDIRWLPYTGKYQSFQIAH
jgi:acylphosphatase